GIASMWLGFFALSHLSLPTAISLNYTAPLFIAGWMLFFGGAQRDPARVLAVLAGFLGVLGVLRPSIQHDEWLAALMGLGAGGLAAVAMMQIRQLGRIGEPEWRTVLLFSLGVCLSGLAGISLQGWHASDPLALLALAGLGLAGLVGQLAMTRAFGLGSTLLTAAPQYMTIIFAALIGVLLWGARPAPLACARIALILGPVMSALLIRPETLRDRLARPGCLVFDVRHDLADHGAGRRAYEAGHVPGALYLDHETQLCALKTGRNGRHPLPDRADFAALMRA